MKWKIIIEDKNGVNREIPLDHEYNTENEAESEAEDIAAQEYTEDDAAWTLTLDAPPKSTRANRR